MRKKTPAPAPDTVSTLLSVVADLVRGDRHSRRTIAEATGKSLPTADRWIEQLEEALPNVRRVRDGKNACAGPSRSHKTAHRDHPIRAIAIAQNGASRSPNTGHRDHLRRG
jgi:hypothetical protein